jgi:hypothetical protein
MTNLVETHDLGIAGHHIPLAFTSKAKVETGGPPLKLVTGLSVIDRIFDNFYVVSSKFEWRQPYCRDDVHIDFVLNINSMKINFHFVYDNLSTAMFRAG